MASSREIVNDLRAQARSLDGRHVRGAMLDGICRSLRRGADEIDRLLAEIHMLRAWAEIPGDE